MSLKQEMESQETLKRNNRNLILNRQILLEELPKLNKFNLKVIFWT